METLDQTHLLVQENEGLLQESLKNISELEAAVGAREERLQNSVKIIEDQEESLRTRDEKICELEGTIDCLHSEMDKKFEEAVEVFKRSDYYRTTIGMVGVCGHEMAYRKSHE
ncbi:hypothetical protein Fot_14632 [Forsythia ovata]|uniref:Uncharacterized protein n=1 Tax=Forsythia ovata TaxID=205694 RepID=A0ABD1W6V2_9LAMI